MIFCPTSKMWPNRFVYVQLPSKKQIFARTGERAVSPSGSYTGDESANFGKTPTQSAEEFARTAERSYSAPETSVKDGD